MPVINILSTMIRSVKERLMNKTKILDRDINWILTVPQRFHSAKQIMEKAAKEVRVNFYLQDMKI